MTEASTAASRGADEPGSPWRRGWPGWVAYAAAAWSLAYGLLGLAWAMGSPGFPFGSEHDPQAAESILEGVQIASAAPVIVFLGVAGMAVALAMTRRPPGAALRRGLLAFAGMMAVTLLVVIPDRRVLVAVAYAPLILLGAPFGWPPASVRGAITWPIINQLILIVGGLFWSGAALVFAGRTAEHAASDDKQVTWMHPEAAARWGRWTVAIAVIVPILFAITRYAWALGIPLGISEAFFRAGEVSGLWLAGAGLATLAVAGAVLTLGLSQRWGEVVPRWMGSLAGKRVPPAVAIAPATLAAIIITAAGLQSVRQFLKAGVPPDGWAVIVPGLLWPVWGIALAAATLAYAIRRRALLVQGSC